jgi:hypothetical protein
MAAQPDAVNFKPATRLPVFRSTRSARAAESAARNRRDSRRQSLSSAFLRTGNWSAAWRPASCANAWNRTRASRAAASCRAARRNPFAALRYAPRAVSVRTSRKMARSFLISLRTPWTDAGWRDLRRRFRASPRCSRHTRRTARAGGSAFLKWNGIANGSMADFYGKRQTAARRAVPIYMAAK